MRAELVVDLDMALARRRPDHGVIFHSDRGCQYTSADYATFAPTAAASTTSAQPTTRPRSTTTPTVRRRDQHNQPVRRTGSSPGVGTKVPVIRRSDVEAARERIRDTSDTLRAGGRSRRAGGRVERSRSSCSSRPPTSLTPRGRRRRWSSDGRRRRGSRPLTDALHPRPVRCGRPTAGGRTRSVCLERPNGRTRRPERRRISAASEGRP